MGGNQDTIYSACKYFRSLFALVLLLGGWYIKAYHSEHEHQRLSVCRCRLTCRVAA